MRVRVLISFNGLVKGTVAEGTPTDRLKAYVDLGYLGVVDDGEDQAGPGGPATGDPGRVGTGAADSGASGGEPGQGFGAGGYGSAESFD